MSDHIEIPANIVTHCPKVQFALVRLNVCAACESFAGIADRFPDHDTLRFANRYQLRCTYEPMRRELKELAE